jgi:hypothetical protein
VGHKFLSNDWFQKIGELREAANVPVPDALKDLVINVAVTGAPDGDVEARMAAGGFEQGFADEAPTKLKIPYDVARKMIVENDQSAAMQAFMSGQIQVEGDMAKLMSMQAAGAPSDAALKLADQIKDITD